MGGISRVMNVATEYAVKKPVNLLMKTSFAKKTCENYQMGGSKGLKFIGALGIASIILKDGLGCIMYVNQSLNNKKIPEEKRKFVAALDLTNGGLMILCQLLMFKTISNKKVQAKLFDKFFGKLFDSKAATKCKDAIMKNPKFKEMSQKTFFETFAKFKGDVQGFFGIITSLVASTILAKRVIVPFIATPLADKAKGLLYKKDEDKNLVQSK